MFMIVEAFGFEGLGIFLVGVAIVSVTRMIMSGKGI